MLHQANLILKQGGVIIIPTETVYGIAADATNKSAVDKIFAIKKRSSSKPLQILVKNIRQAKRYAIFNEKAEMLAEKYFPGALTLILNEKEGSNISKNIHSTDKSLGIRIPDHKILTELFEYIDFPLACTSANISSEKPIIDFRAAKEIFEDMVDFTIDGGK